MRAKQLQEIISNPGCGGCGILAMAELCAGPSHELLLQALQGLVSMEHRGGQINNTGDGAGILLRPERSFFERFISPGRHLPSVKEPLIVGQIFFLRGERNLRELQREVDLILRREGLAPLGWRKIPIDETVLGRRAQEDLPLIYQILVGKGHRRETQLFEVLHQIKVAIEDKLSRLASVISLAPYTTVYKALATANQLKDFYLDLKNPEFKTKIVIAHRRFSTNTFCNWNLVQPFRHIAHNGEINTITANCRAVRDAESAINLRNTLMDHGSDSAQFDRVAEMLAAYGMTGIHEAVRRMVPPPWIEEQVSEQEYRFFEANRRALGTIGAWEGPMALVGSDGQIVFAILDRMGLRPLRYVKTHSGRVIIASEMGTIPVSDADIVSDGQLEPGQMIIADLKTASFVLPEEANQWIIQRTGLNFQNLSTLDLASLANGQAHGPLPIKALNAFGWTKERVNNLKDMIKNTKEPIMSMGNDRPLAIFSENHSRLYSYLHQIVAVVTNPPIDPIREGGAMDMTVYLGRSPIISRKSTYKSWPQYELEYPILTNEQLDALLAAAEPDLQTYKLDATFVDKGKAREIVRRIHDLTEEAVKIIKAKKASILVLSDYEATKGGCLPLPMLLAVSAIHRALADNGLRRDASIVVSSGEVQEGHDLAILLAYGATAVNPYAIFDLVRNFSEFEAKQAVASTIQALIHTLKSIMSKMGITTFASYRGSALFEAIGISSDVVEYYIPDTVSRLGGLNTDHIYQDIISRQIEKEDLSQNQNISVYRKEVVDSLQLVARYGNTNGDYDRFCQLLKDTPPVYLRDMLEFNPQKTKPINLDQVVTAAEIIKTTIRGAAMSHGALNGTAHRAIAAAFNHFDSCYNSGEGGEDSRRNIGGQWEKSRSKTRQIASGRFGVDAAYLANAEEIEIKIGQGAKPGEGGHLPGKKVTAEIAHIRKTQEGVDLISPPPHHDIYSIEDLAQLIRNLREFNPKAIIGVKVPSITRLGTIAVGIVKAGADIITISCFTGGTGAARRGSIFHAGLPLERGISEVHQYLVVNDLRSHVRLRADGGIKYGVDMAKIIALGADEVTVGTPLLIAENCIFCRGCTKGKCPVGIATHDEKIHNSFFMRRAGMDIGQPEATLEERYLQAKKGVINYLECLGGHFRAILAELGFSHPSELVGRVDLLQQIVGNHPRWDSLELIDLLQDMQEGKSEAVIKKTSNKNNVSEKNKKILEAAQNGQTNISFILNNNDQAFGASLAKEIAEKNILKDKEFEINVQGYAGQGFGFAATSGMKLKLAGYANDAVGEIMSGSAQITIMPPAERKTNQTPHLIGNAAAYGATGGKLYVAGSAGQRFGVRNSGATLVCEGVGKYAFEYMTGGVGVVLGKCGSCLGSGMTGGKLYIYNPDANRKFSLVKISDCSYEDELKQILEDYVKATQSLRAKYILENWPVEKKNFICLLPLEAKAS
ncbi:MAG: glutamate synthase large subunit [Pseudomonadota bacterium]